MNLLELVFGIGAPDTFAPTKVEVFRRLTANIDTPQPRLGIVRIQITILLSKHKHGGTQVSCDAHRERHSASRIS
jgi:hypothetical protein